jgi:DNA-binding response OmpR family regulator
MIGKITSVAVLGDKILEIGWDDGLVAPVDLTEVIAARKALAPLRTKREFARVAVSRDSWSLEWPCGIDFGAEQLRRLADERAGEIMRVADFRAWMDEHGLTQEAAAQALGLSRRMIAYYLSGEKVIPKTVMLATEGWAGRVEA